MVHTIGVEFVIMLVYVANMTSKRTTKQCNQDCLKSESTEDTHEMSTCACLCTPHRRTLFGEGFVCLFGEEGGNIISSVFCFAATQLALQLHQERAQVVCSIEEAQKRLAEALPQWTLDSKANAYTCSQIKEKQNKTHIKKHGIRRTHI